MRAVELRWQFRNVTRVEVITVEIVQRLIVYIMHSPVAMFYMDGQQYPSYLQNPGFKFHLQPAEFSACCKVSLLTNLTPMLTFFSMCSDNLSSAHVTHQTKKESRKL